jgi:hypothetical protein
VGAIDDDCNRFHATADVVKLRPRVLIFVDSIYLLPESRHSCSNGTVLPDSPAEFGKIDRQLRTREAHKVRGNQTEGLG